MVGGAKDRADEQEAPEGAAKPRSASRSGLVFALRNLLRLARSSAPESEENAAIWRDGGIAIAALQDLLDCLPDGHELATMYHRAYSLRKTLNDAGAGGGFPSLETRWFRQAAGRIEEALDRCHAASLSANPEAVAEACAVLQDVQQACPTLDLGLTRGDCMSAHMLGGTLACVLPQGRRIELTLRQTHPAIDDGVPRGVWVVEGMAVGEKGRIKAECDMTMGPFLPLDTAHVLVGQVRRLADACSDVHRLHAHKGRRPPRR